MNKSDIVVACRDLHKSYGVDSRQTSVLTGIDLQIKNGERVAILGRSGSGKSTLLHLLGGLDLPTSGDVQLGGKHLSKLNEQELTRLRNQSLGFVYQFHHLLPEFTVLENVTMPLLIRGVKASIGKDKSTEILHQIGMGHRLHHKIGQLSGGERQRTAIARALVTEPLCILADEPTGNLDQQTSQQVYEAMIRLNEQLKTSLLIVTHDTRLSANMDRVLCLEGGVLSV